MGIFRFIMRFWAGSWAWKTVLIAAIIAVVGIVVVFRGRSGSGPDTGITVVRGSIEETVSVTGDVKPNSEVQLSFQSSGRVGNVTVAVGASVSAGQVLASLQNGELQAQLRDALANVSAQQARLDELIQGPRAEDIRISQAQNAQAQQNLQNAYDTIDDVLNSALTTTDTAIHNQLEGIFDQVGTIGYPSYKLTFSCFCDQLDLTVNEQRTSTEAALTQWRTDLNALYATPLTEVRVAALQRALQSLSTANAMLGNLAIILNHPTVSLPEATAATYRTAANTARAGVVSAQNAVTTQQQSVRSLQITAEQVAGQLAKLLSGSSTQAITVQRAQVQSAIAQSERVQALIGNGTIRSPFAGIITRQDAKVGQNATANVPLITVISGGQYELQANIPEIDIGKVSVGNPAAVEVDALPGEVLLAHVSFIEPAQTVIDGVVNFKVTLKLDRPDIRLKSGLTVNLDIQTQRREGVLLLPQYAILQNDEGSFVSRIQEGGTVQVPVTLGILSQDGMVEVVSGVQEGDRVENVGLKK